jgi:hypothetical protein
MQTAGTAIEKVREFLNNLDKSVKDIAGAGVSEYLIGDESHGLKHYPLYKHVSWAEIGGFVSDKQRRFVMAMIGKGEITPGISQSNGYFRDAWQYKKQGPNYIITNDVGYGPYLVSASGWQSKMAKAHGWRTTLENMRDNADGAIRHAVAKINEWMKSHAKG